MRTLPLLAARLFNTPHAIEPAKMRQILWALRADLGLDLSGWDAGAFDDDLGPEAEGETFRGYDLVEGIAVFKIHGTLVQRAGPLDAVSGLVGYDRLQASLDTAVDDTAVRGILLDIDSGGGEVAGLYDLADHIRGLRSRIPLASLARDFAASAAFVLASAAKDVYLTQSAVVGSIGIIMAHVDQTGADEQDGLKVSEIFAGPHKADGHAHHALGDEERKRLQAMVDSHYDIIATHVARNLGLTAEAIKATRSGVFVGREAIGARLAKGIFTFEGALERLNDAAGPRRFFGASRPQQPRSAGMSKRIFAATAGLAAILTASRAALISSGVATEELETRLANATGLDAEALDGVFAGSGDKITGKVLEGVGTALGIPTDGLKTAAVAPQPAALPGPVVTSPSASNGPADPATVAEMCTAAGFPSLTARLLKGTASLDDASAAIEQAKGVLDVCATFDRRDLADQFVGLGLTAEQTRATLAPLAAEDGDPVDQHHGANPGLNVGAAIDTDAIYAARRAAVEAA